jgi:YegS/Rv2252/BmrU family lipid kinase
MTMRAALIYNPESGRGKKKKKLLPHLLERLRYFGVDAQPTPTAAANHATELAREALERRVELVVVWGGDGTINEVARGMLGSGTRLGIIPGGTVNVFARETGIPLRLEDASRNLVEGVPRKIPVGRAGGRPFLLMAGIGLDAQVVYGLSPSLKKRLGTLAFWLEGFRLLVVYPFDPLTVRADGKEYEATSVIAGKLRRYGTGYFITPDARLEEPLLDVVLFQGRWGPGYLRYLFGVAGGFHLKLKDVVHIKASRLEVESKARIYYQLDGEVAGTLPVQLDVLPEALNVVLPPES